MKAKRKEGATHYGTAHTLAGPVEFHLLPGQFFWIALSLECGHFIEIDLRLVPGAIDEDMAHMRRVCKLVNAGDWRGYVELVEERLDGRDVSAAIARGLPHAHELAN